MATKKELIEDIKSLAPDADVDGKTNTELSFMLSELRESQPEAVEPAAAEPAAAEPEAVEAKPDFVEAARAKFDKMIEERRKDADFSGSGQRTHGTVRNLMRNPQMVVDQLVPQGGTYKVEPGLTGLRLRRVLNAIEIKMLEWID